MISAFDTLQNKFAGNSNIGRNFLEYFKVCFAFPEKWFCICQGNLAFSSLEPIFNHSEDSIYGFHRLQGKFIGSSNIRRKFLENFKLWKAFPQKWFCIRQPNLAFSSLEHILHGPEDSISAFDTLKKKFIGNSNIGRKVLEYFKVCLAFPEKWFCIRQPNLVS